MDQIGRLYTLGYSRHRTAEALAQLARTHGFTTVIDVRFRPWPPQPKAIVEVANLHYLWDRRLGNTEYKTGGIRIVDIEAVESILERIREGESVAIICTCADSESCHRRVIADECRRRVPELQVVDL